MSGRSWGKGELTGRDEEFGESMPGAAAFSLSYDCRSSVVLELRLAGRVTLYT